jgi:hypothetical protein
MKMAPWESKKTNSKNLSVMLSQAWQIDMPLSCIQNYSSLTPCIDICSMPKNSFDPLASLYQSMDMVWGKAADHYNFKYNSCDDNCCKSLFYHHTSIEKSYILKGFQSFDQQIKDNIIQKSKAYYQKIFSNNGSIENAKIMYLLNKKGHCLIYGHRPMICRLHGLPHELIRPGIIPLKGPRYDTAGNILTPKSILHSTEPIFTSRWQPLR